MVRFLSNGVLVRSVLRATLWVSVYVFGFFKLDLRWLLLFLAASYLIYVWLKHGEESVAGGTAALLPAWVLSPDMQRSEWVNAIFRQLWPHVEESLKRAFEEFEANEDEIKGPIRLDDYVNDPLIK